ncbi:MAG TPA: hypothetical protein VFL14_00010 [Xanthomonadales bacterium]|nr:hypothetical protein [Xanthomonadales bacterium]
MRIALFAALLGASVPAPVAAAKDVEYVRAAEFRIQFPVPANAAELRGTFERIDAAFRDAAADGARAKVKLRTVDGEMHRGEDRYLFGAVRRSHERRDNYESFSRDDRVCIRTGADEEFDCADRGVIYALYRPSWDALVSGTQREVACGRARCTKLTLVFAEAIDLELENLPPRVFSTEPDVAGTRITLLATLPGMRPVTLEQLDHYKDGEQATATYVYDLDADVGTIALPE